MTRRATWFSLILVLGCGDDTAGHDGTESSTGTQDGSGSHSGTSATSDGSSGGPACPPGSTGEPPDPTKYCDLEITKCKEDEDEDGVHHACDNAPRVFNPDQSDLDKDSFGDAVDLCPTVQTLNNTADTDRDGVGNDCDTCRFAPSSYDLGVPLPAALRVRGNPHQLDTDRDGIGDACDNCVLVPNCEGYGNGDGQTPHQVGMPIDYEACQQDLDANMIGDACEGTMAPGAAGPVGFAADDDFDQDGLANAVDLCPRISVAARQCASADDCDGAACTGATCNHRDTDGDGVGDVCDTCPYVANPEQLMEGAMQDDDVDGDFVGAACEGHAECIERANPHPFAFYDVSVDGVCCVTSHDGAVIEDPDGNPIDTDTLERPPGVLELPPGCEQALAGGCGAGHAVALRPQDLEDPGEIWQYLCRLPVRDQDLDGVPDSCDLCRFTWDPGQEPYVDANGMVWPQDGKYCNGEYHVDVNCDLGG